MTKYIIRRVIQAIPVLIGITIVVYVILQLAPGGPQAKFAQNPRMTNEQKAPFMKAWGLDQPIPIQYCRWMGICDANGEGLRLHRPDGLAELPAERDQRRHERHPPRRPRLLDHIRREGQRRDHPGGPADVHPGRRRPGHLDQHGDRDRGVLGDQALLVVRQRRRRSSPTSASRSRRSGSGSCSSTSSGRRGSCRSAGWSTSGCRRRSATTRTGCTSGSTRSTRSSTSAKHLILPVVTLVVVNIAGDSRFVRASMLDALNQDYVRTAKAKGLPGRTRHVQARAAERAAAGRHEHRPRDPVPVHRARSSPRRSSRGRASAS